ncbi:hypothetical protein P3X46_001131 [Hevea brasiliensis]|uniref:Serine-threonine/tyrosine-protein kinase catalytic domain-containing protein n=1 Tax=Hevea brasiliensis TaxID=3981 RepID=A0ABQ9NFF9_HEVBR|nr:hypothetical protein P3X46_001131 [Hevea brasiliensis]
MLTDGRIVAIKKSKLVDEEKTEVPLLAYDFIPNGSLFEYLHGQSEEAPLPWEMRVRIAGEVARALASIAIDQTHLTTHVQETKVFDIIDARIVEHCPEEEIIEVSNLAKRWLNLSGKKRPTMQEVAVELEGIQASRSKMNIQQNNEEIKDALSDDASITDSCDTEDTLTDDIAIAVSCDFSNVKAPSMKVEPLIANKT